MSNERQVLQIRKKKLGLLIFDARKAKRRSTEECAQALSVTSDQFQEFERGVLAPSLPQLELLALYLDVPLEHFWGRRALSEAISPETMQEKDRLMLLRNRVIGTNLRLARNNANFSYREIAEKTGIPEEQMKRYEMGEVAVPTPELELLSNVLDVPIEQFYDRHGPIGKWRSQQGNYLKFLDLPPDIQQFVCKPVNRPYLELAMRLSDLSAEKLRAVAEVLLEITY
ncbi:MAG: transcriptional regulator [Chloroflexi bacterium]|nr:MAG: transcriptional regulator [Chloroflexota bacterium]